MRIALFRAALFLALTCATAPAANAQRPQLLKRHGVIYGVRGIANSSCKGTPVPDACEVYSLSGTVVSVAYDNWKPRIDGFTLRTANGRIKFQNILIDSFPLAAERLIEPRNYVHVSGTIAGQGRVAMPSEIILERGR